MVTGASNLQNWQKIITLVHCILSYFKCAVFTSHMIALCEEQTEMKIIIY